MIVGRLVKEQTDIVRVRVDFVPWLDAGEHIDSIQTSWVSPDTSGWALTEPPWPSENDLTTLEIQSIALIGGNTEVELFLAAGTPSNTYTVTFIIHAQTHREVTTEIGVQISGPPPELIDQANVLLAEGGISRLGDTMHGPLYLVGEPYPLVPSEAAPKRYVDLLRHFVEDEFTLADEVVTEAMTALIDAEAAARAAEDVALNTRVDAETAARIAADTTLQTNITNEANARVAGDNNEAASRVAGDSNEATARNNADVALGVRIDSVTSTGSSGIVTLTANLAAETAARTAADTTLQTNIHNEEVNRIASDTSFNTRIVALETALAAAGTLPQVRHGAVISDSAGAFSITFAPAFPSTCDAIVVSAQSTSWWANVNTWSSTGASGETSSPLHSSGFTGGPMGVQFIAVGH